MPLDTMTLSAPGLRPLAERPWFNALWFQTTWFCTVLGRDALLPASLLLIALHLLLVPRRSRELAQLALLGGLGMLLDTALSLAGVFVFPGNVILPAWLICLWLAFVSTPGRSLAFLAPHPWLTAALGAVVVPFNYYAGSQFGAVSFGVPVWQALLIMALAWGLLLPTLYWLHGRLFAPREE